MNITTQVEEFVCFFEQFTLKDIEKMGDFYHDAAYFRDPFNEVHSLTAIQNIFRHMFLQVNQPRFEVINTLIDHSNIVLTWNFYFQFKFSRHRVSKIHGVSILQIDASGKIISHIDYWDAGQQLYEKLPFVGGVFRWIRRAMGSPQEQSVL